MASASKTRGGFSLLEALVVIGIICVLVALLMPVIQSSRESARRCHCASNLKNVMMAVQNYETSFGSFPPGAIARTGPAPSARPGNPIGWIAHVLPYMEQQTTYAQIDFSIGANQGSNRALRSVTISVLQCPSDITPASSPPRPAGASSYAGCHHDVEAPIAEDNHGVFYLNSHLQFEDIEDGRSNTIFLGEKLLNDPADLGWLSGTRSTLRNTGTQLNAALGGGAATGRAATLPQNYIGGFSSRHRGGANFGFGDGRVDFLDETIDAGVYRQLGHRADGRLLDAADWISRRGR